MRFLLLVLFLGCVSAISHDALQRASEDVVDSFISGMASAPSLHQALGIQETEEVKRFESDIKEELAKYLREVFDKALEKISDAIKKGQNIHKEALEKLKDLREKMKDLNIEDDEVAEHLLKGIKERVKGQLKELLKKLGIIDGEEKRSIDFDELMKSDDNILGDLNIRNFIIRVKEMILEKMDPESLKKSIAKVVGQGAERLCEWLTNKGKEKVLNFFDRVLEKDDDKKKRSISDLYQQIKDYFEGLDLDFQQKFLKFGEWVKEVLEKGLNKSKTKIESVKAIAKQLLEKSKVISKEVAAQALEYLKGYKEELGELYDKVQSKLIEKIMDNID